MLRTTLLALTLVATSSAVAAAPCKDAKGRFTKCPTPASKPASGGVTKGKDGKCRDAKGHFAKCPS